MEREFIIICQHGEVLATASYTEERWQALLGPSVELLRVSGSDLRQAKQEALARGVQFPWVEAIILRS